MEGRDRGREEGAHASFTDGKCMGCVNPMTLIGNKKDQSLKYIEHLV